MNILFRSLWFVFTVMIGMLAGLWARRWTIDQPKAVVASTPKPKLIEATTPSLPVKVALPSAIDFKRIPIEEMDNEVDLHKRIDNQYATLTFFNKNGLESSKASGFAIRLTNLKFQSNGYLCYTFKQAKSEEEKRKIYNELAYKRLYDQIFLYEVAKQENLLVKPIDKSVPKRPPPVYTKMYPVPIRFEHEKSKKTAPPESAPPKTFE